MIQRRTITSDAPPSPDVYFSPGYGAACQIDSGGTWLGLGDEEGEWQLPILISPVPNHDGIWDGSSPYGYAGVATTSGLSEDRQRKLWSQATDALRDSGVVALFLRHSPLVPTMSPHLMGSHVEVVSDHPTIVVDISSPDTMWEALAGRTRTAVRKALKSGLTAHVRPMDVHDCDGGSPFRRLYSSTMERVGANARYHFPDDYFVTLRDRLRGNLYVAEVTDEDGDTGAAALLMRHGNIVHYHLSGSNPTKARLGANNLMIWAAMTWAAEYGLDRFHLGGGVSLNDPLLRFKQSFGGRELSFSATGHIIIPDRYDQLVRRTRQDPERPPNFFPAYRWSAN